MFCEIKRKQIYSIPNWVTPLGPTPPHHDKRKVSGKKKKYEKCDELMAVGYGGWFLIMTLGLVKTL